MSNHRSKKAVVYARKHIITVPLKGNDYPSMVQLKLGAARIMIKPAPPGTGGVRAGGPVRAVVEAVGIQDIVSKILGTNNKASNVYATIA